MKHWIKLSIFFLCTGAVIGTGFIKPIVPVKADPPKTALSVPTYYLTMVRVADVKPNQFVWMLSNRTDVAFHSLSAPTLRSEVSHFPVGSNIEFSHSDNLIGGELYDEVPEFKIYCESKKVNFIYMPAG